jgi:hypothetical protein
MVLCERSNVTTCRINSDRRRAGPDLATRATKGVLKSEIRKGISPKGQDIRDPVWKRDRLRNVQSGASVRFVPLYGSSII